MKVIVASGFYVYTCGNKVYAKQKHSSILMRYYNAFGKMTLFVRVKSIQQLDRDLVDITEIVISVIKAESHSKVLMNKYREKVSEAIKESDLVIVRCHGAAAFRAYDYARKLNKPVLAEAMGSAWDAFWNHGVSGKVIAPYMHMKMKQVMKSADYAVYVTEKFLQEHYPCTCDSIAASNVVLQHTSEDVLERRIARIRDMDSKQLVLMTTAAVDVRYKGQEYVIRAIPMLNHAGIKVQYRIIGEGSDEYLRQVVDECGVKDQVEFFGRLPLEDVFKNLDECDVYVQPSLQEGLPRSVIEALSRGCFCIGARTAGIPELIQSEFVVERKNSKDIVDRIVRYSKMDFHERERIANDNFHKARSYESEVLDQRRNDYFDKIKKDISV